MVRVGERLARRRHHAEYAAYGSRILLHFLALLLGQVGLRLRHDGDEMMAEITAHEGLYFRKPPAMFDLCNILKQRLKYLCIIHISCQKHTTTTTYCISCTEPEMIREAERVVLLKVIDRKWMNHIDDMDQLRQGIGLQAYGQRDPLVEYKMNAYEMFENMTESIKEDTIRVLCHIRIEQKVEREQVAKVTGTNKDESGPRRPAKRESVKIYPNDPCPCGSGKKYKNCCGKNR